MQVGARNPADVVDIGSVMDGPTSHNIAPEDVMGMEGEEKTALFMVADSVSSEVMERKCVTISVTRINAVLHTFAYSLFLMKTEM